MCWDRILISPLILNCFPFDSHWIYTGFHLVFVRCSFGFFRRMFIILWVGLAFLWFSFDAHGMVLLGWIMPDQYDWVGLASASPHAGSSRLGWVVPDHHDWVALWNRAVAYGKALWAPQNTVTSQQHRLLSSYRTGAARTLGEQAGQGHGRFCSSPGGRQKSQPTLERPLNKKMTKSSSHE